MELQNLYLVSSDRDGAFDEKIVVMNQKSLDYYSKHPQWYGNITVIEELGKLWAKNATVEVASKGSGRCYVWAKYKITADDKLNEQDMKVIRAQYPFLEGQRTAAVDLNKFEEVEGKFVYMASSECDSSD